VTTVTRSGLRGVVKSDSYPTTARRSPELAAAAAGRALVGTQFFRDFDHIIFAVRWLMSHRAGLPAGLAR